MGVFTLGLRRRRRGSDKSKLEIFRLSDYSDAGGGRNVELPEDFYCFCGLRNLELLHLQHLWDWDMDVYALHFPCSAIAFQLLIGEFSTPLNANGFRGATAVKAKRESEDGEEYEFDPLVFDSLQIPPGESFAPSRFTSSSGLTLNWGWILIDSTDLLGAEWPSLTWDVAYEIGAVVHAGGGVSAFAPYFSSNDYRSRYPMSSNGATVFELRVAEIKGGFPMGRWRWWRSSILGWRYTTPYRVLKALLCTAFTNLLMNIDCIVQWNCNLGKHHSSEKR